MLFGAELALSNIANPRCVSAEPSHTPGQFSSTHCVLTCTSWNPLCSKNQISNMAWNRKGDFLLECLVCLLHCHHCSQRSGFSLERAELMVKAIPCRVKWAGEKHCETQLGWRLDLSVLWCLLGRGCWGTRAGRGLCAGFALLFRLLRIHPDFQFRALAYRVTKKETTTPVKVSREGKLDS